MGGVDWSGPRLLGLGPGGFIDRARSGNIPEIGSGSDEVGERLGSVQWPRDASPKITPKVMPDAITVGSSLRRSDPPEGTSRFDRDRAGSVRESLLAADGGDRAGTQGVRCDGRLAVQYGWRLKHRERSVGPIRNDEAAARAGEAAVRRRPCCRKCCASTVDAQRLRPACRHVLRARI